MTTTNLVLQHTGMDDTTLDFWNLRRMGARRGDTFGADKATSSGFDGVACDDVVTVVDVRDVRTVSDQTHRQANLSRFAGDARFLIANKTCAGYGLNLQFCRNAIYYSNDWSWGTRAQSEDRLHRIGQNQTVRLWDIAASHTLDERILDCLARKGNLVDEFKRALKKRNFADWLRGNPESDLLDVGG